MEKPKRPPAECFFRKKRLLFLFFLLLLGLAIRVHFVPSFIKESGDIRLYADWGRLFWEYGSKNFYYINDWYYAPPNYPPIISLIYAGSWWLYDHKYVLPQIHNATKLIPSAFIIYFYKNGYFLLLKLPGILADLGLSVLVYFLVFKLTQNYSRSFLAFIFYLFNPIPIFLSSVWGQTDSLIALLGLSSFVALYFGNVGISFPLLFTSLYIKPNWAIFLPLYLYLFYLKKPKLRTILVGSLLSLVIFFITTQPFAKGNVINFVYWLLRTRILPTATLVNKASVSAFNFHTIFFVIDSQADTAPILGIPANLFGLSAFAMSNVLAFMFIKRAKANLLSIIASIFAIGFSSYLFLTNMLERYFFSSFAPLIIVSFVNPKLFLNMVFINLITFLNLVYSFFRRTSDEVGHIFINYNFLVLRILSFLNLTLYLLIARYFLQKENANSS